MSKALMGMASSLILTAVVSCSYTQNEGLKQSEAWASAEVNDVVSLSDLGELSLRNGMLFAGDKRLAKRVPNPTGL